MKMKKKNEKEKKNEDDKGSGDEFQETNLSLVDEVVPDPKSNVKKLIQYDFRHEQEVKGCYESYDKRRMELSRELSLLQEFQLHYLLCHVIAIVTRGA